MSWSPLTSLKDLTFPLTFKNSCNITFNFPTPYFKYSNPNKAAFPRAKFLCHISHALQSLLTYFCGQNCSMLPLAFIAGWLQGHWWGFISRNYVVWPTFLLMNVFIALKGSHFWFLFDFTAAGVVPCGGRKTSPRTSSIVQFIFYFGPLRSAIIFWEIRNKWLFRLVF